MAVNANLTVSDDWIIDFKSKDMSNSQIGDTQTSKSQKLRKWSYCEIRSNSKFHFLGPNFFFQNRKFVQSQLIDFEQICQFRFLIFEFSKIRENTLLLVILIVLIRIVILIELVEVPRLLLRLVVIVGCFHDFLKIRKSKSKQTDLF